MRSDFQKIFHLGKGRIDPCKKGEWTEVKRL